MAVDTLRAEVGQLQRRLAQAAPRRAVVEMDRAISLLHSRVEELRQTSGGAGHGSGPEDMAYLAEELLDLRTSLDTMRAPERFQALSAGVEMLSRKIDILNARAVDPVEVARLQAQSNELKSLVTRMVSGSGLQPLAERLAACAEEIARSSDAAAQRVADATSTFERNAEAVIRRVNAYEASVHEARNATAQDLRRDVEANLHGIHDRLDKVTQYLASLSPAAGSELAAHVTGLLERLDAAKARDAAAAIPLAEVVERHLLALTDRFQDASARLERLDGIEITLTEMIDELRRAREVSSEATQEAVEVAVEAVSRKVSTDPAGPAVVGLKRGLAALEARQAEVERRASELLGETLAREIEDRTVVLGRTGDDAWAPHPLVEDEPGQPGEQDFAAYGDEGIDRDPPADDAPAASAEAAFEPEPHHAPVVEPRLPPEPAAADLGDIRPDPMAAPRPKRVSRGRRAPADIQFASPSRGQDARPQVERRTRGVGHAPLAKVSPAVIAVAGLALLATVSGATAWVHRDAIVAMAQQAAHQVKMAAATPATPSHPDEVAAAAKSTAQLPAPIGPQALRMAALDGNLAAAYEVGVRFADGVGVDQDVDAGIKWLGYAVSRSFAPAAYRLGSLYENTLHNMDEAYRFYKWAAEQGNVRAMHNLGVLYSQGIAGAPDWSEALKWFRKAANLGLKDSQHNLGIIFARGFSGTSDLAEALTWFNIAARQGDQDSADKRDALAREADEVVLARAKKAADAFVPKPINEAANVVAVLPEWNASEAGEHVAANTMATNTLASNTLTSGAASASTVLFSGNLLASKH
ncbi:hypothetical protein [Xanthobacter agilis]|uniref:hypothetical protein n=1 Tax=Xanthobacter agilis TaxID=47492 RepID=UPI003726E8BE